MYLTLIVTFTLIMVLVVAGIQNSIAVEIKFLAWVIQLSVSWIIFYAALLGGAIVALLSLPGLVRQVLKNRSFRREMRELRQRLDRIEKDTESGEG